MNKMEKNKTIWKDHLLKSGLPLEYEIKKILDAEGCISNNEYTYLRNNENEISTEFSYDVDTSYIKDNHFIDLMIECKYRHESTKWIFLPDDYGGIDDVHHSDFMHPINHFVRKKTLEIDFPIAFGPLCSKGIEITSDGANPKSITQAISQLSYAMAKKIVSAISHQTEKPFQNVFANTTFYSIPVIITTAQLFRLREDIDIDTIKNAENIEAVASREPFLVLKSKPGRSLRDYNNKIFNEYILITGEQYLRKKLNSFSKDLWFVMSHIAEHDCPNSIVVIHYNKVNNNIAEFFNFINRVIKPDKEIIELVKKKQDKIDDWFKKFEQEHPHVDLSGGIKQKNFRLKRQNDKNSYPK